MATYISNQTGLWSSASTWLTAAAGTLTPSASAGYAPVSFGGDKIIIRSGHTVTYDVVGCFGDETAAYGAGGTTTATFTNLSSNGIILSGGTLKASRTLNVELTARGNFTIAPSGTLDWGTTVDPLTTTANITLHYMSQLSALSASPCAAGLNLYGADNVNAMFYNNMWINGKPKTRNTTLSVSASNGASILTLTSPISTLKWEVGDKLVIQSESITAGVAYNSTTTFLSATFIQSFTGNQITISPVLNTARSAGISVGNFTSNVTIKSYNPYYASYGVYVHGNNAFTVDINYIKLEPMSNGLGSLGIGAGWLPMAINGVRQTVAVNGQQNAPFSFNSSYSVTTTSCQPLNMKGICVESVNTFPTATYGSNYFQTNAIYVNGRWADSHTFDDWAVFYQNFGNMYGIHVNSIASANFKNWAIYRTSYGMTLNNAFPNLITFDNCKWDCHISIANSTYGLQTTFSNCTFRSFVTNGTMWTYDTIQNLNYKNCTFVGNVSTGAWFRPNVNAVANVVLANCSLYNGTSAISLITKDAIGAANQSSQQTKFDIYQPNNSTYDYRRFNYFHYSQTDSTTRKRGITTYRIKPEKADVQFNNYFTLAGVLSTPQRIKGSLQFDSNYGTTYPPSISFIGAGVNTTFTCTSAVNIWQDFDYTLTPTTTDDIIVTITCQSTLTTGYVWLDGLPIYPFIQDVRHYGFVFDKASDRTVNTSTTLTENQVSGLAVVDNLDYIYDAASYWSVTNPASSSYIDLYTANGTVLDFGSKNIIINNTGTGFSYNSASSTITINAPSLSAGVNFNTIKTSGTVTLSTGIISNIDINANLIQTIPTSLNGVYMLSSSNTLTYNTNTPIEIEYTNCTVVGVKNDGTALVTIKRTNSTVTESDAEVSTYAPTIINLTLQGGYAAIYDDTGTRQYYTNSNGTVVLGSTASGSWSYKIARYGYQLISGNFTVNPSVGGTIDIAPNYIPDAFITVANVATVSGYTDLNTYDKIHDYLSYYLTTSTGINYGELDSESFGVLNFNSNLIMSGSASSIVEYTSGSNTLKLKSSTINDSIIFVIASAFTQDGGNTIGDNMKIRSSNLDSELYFNNVNSIIFYPSLSDRDNNTNAGISLSSVSIYRFKYGSTVNGVTFTDYVYSRVTVDGSTLLYATPIATGSTTIDFGTVGNLQTILNNQRIINIGVQKASKLIPHTTNI